MVPVFGAHHQRCPVTRRCTRTFTRAQVVLDEDTYVDTLDTIIQRDYFPALKPLNRMLVMTRLSCSI
jgi:hypothetical protein